MQYLAIGAFLRLRRLRPPRLNFPRLCRGVLPLQLLALESKTFRYAKVNTSPKYMIRIVPVVLCGGSGTRLWPLSRTGFPKQFLALTGNTSLFQQTVARMNQLAGGDIESGSTLVVTNEQHRFLALEQLREMNQGSTSSLLLEPIGRNTAPALTLAALHASVEQNDPVLVVTPADHSIKNVAAFASAIQKGIRTAATGAIVTLGVSPVHPSSGYGYIKCSGAAGANGEFRVAHFTEKPDVETARTYLSSGEYFWNSGIFLVKASVWLRALAHFRPDISNATINAWSERTTDRKFVRPGASLFEKIPNESVDIAVVENCPESSFPLDMVPLPCGWSDLGTWDAVWEIRDKDARGNAIHGDVVAIDTSNTLIHAGNRLVGTLGINNLVVVETADAVLVADRTKDQEIGMIISALTKEKREEHNTHRKVHRPWGWYDSIDESEGFKVKRLRVNPGASLSLQKHQFRAEHWIVVNGTAEVTCGDRIFSLNANQSTYIPLGEKHRLANPGSVTLEVIEVQSGSYLGEDDIFRFEDAFGRAN